MSGVKRQTTTVISTRELGRLRRQAADASNYRQASAAMAAINEQLTEQMSASNSRIRGLEDSLRKNSAELEKARKNTSRLQNDLRRVVAESDQRLAEQAAYFGGELDRMRTDVFDAMRNNNARVVDMINRNNEIISGKMDSLRETVGAQLEATNNRIDMLDETVSNMARGNADLLAAARDYFAVASEICADIANYRYELLCPGRMSELQEHISGVLARINEAEKNPMTSANTRDAARDVYAEALRLYEDVIRAENEWEICYGLACQADLAATAAIEENRTTTDDEIYGDVDVDYWTNGSLNKLSDRVNTFRENLENGRDSLTASELDDIRCACEQVTSEVYDAAAYAICLLRTSQTRADNGQDIAEVMFDRYGLNVISFGYEGGNAMEDDRNVGDCRGSYRFHMKNPDTSFEIAITQTTVVNEDGSVGIKIESDIVDYGSIKNKDEGDELAAEIMGMLSERYGCAVHEVPGYRNKPSDRVTPTNAGEFYHRATPIGIPRTPTGNADAVNAENSGKGEAATRR